MTQRFKIAGRSGKLHDVGYDAYRWKHLIRFLVDHANGEELLVLEVNIDTPEEATLLAWGYQSMHDDLIEMHWQPIEANFPENYKVVVAAKLATKRMRPSESQAKVLETEAASNSPYIRTRPR